MSTKHLHYITGAILMLILLVCLFTLLLPTRLTIIPANDILRAKSYIITVSTGLHLHTFALPPFDDQLTAIKISGFNASAFVEYPKYFIGIFVVMILTVAGLCLNSVLIARLRNEPV